MNNIGKSKKILLVVLAAVLLPAAAAGVAVGLLSPKEDAVVAPTIGVVRVAEPEQIQLSAAQTNNIRDAEVLGLWNDARLSDGYGPAKSYDNKKASKWNPATCNDYLGDPSIVYLLDGRFDMDSWEMILSAREIFFDFYVSKDGKEFTLLQSITKDNYQQFYKTEGDRFHFALNTPDAKDIAFVKLLFKGSNSQNNSPWMSIHDVRCIGTRLGDGPAKMPEFEDPYKVDKLEVMSYELTGKWHVDQTKVAEVGPARSYDGNIYSMWNPGAQPQFEGKPGIIYHLAQPQNIGKMQFYFGKYSHYFNVYVSQDGEKYTPVAKISFANEDEAYTKDSNGACICTLDGLELKDIQHIKLIFTGRSDNSVPWVVLNEVLTFEEGTKGLDTDWMMRTEPISTHPWIKSTKLVGKWKNDREKDLSWSRYKTYDENVDTFWNPEAKAKYAGQPGIQFTLKKKMDLNKVQFTFATDPYYFDLYVSKNGKDYTKIADISWANADKAYKTKGDKYICTLDSLELENIQYIKLVFTGRKNGSTWVSLHDVSLSEGGKTGKDTSWMLRTEPESKHPWIDTSKLIGSWNNDREKDPTPDWNRFKSYDTDKKTFWNPEAKGGYAGEPGIVYTLKKAMDLKKLELTFNDIYYFNLYTSTDGTEYTQIAAISRYNADLAYAAGSDKMQVCTLDGLDISGVKHIKLVFTGRKTSNAWVSIYEVTLSQEGTEGLDTSWMMADSPISNHPYIAAATVTGQWNLDRVDDEFWGVLQTFDEKTDTFWNPEAKPNYTDDPGVLFTLKNPMDLKKLEFNFGTNVPYFNVFVSQDGTTYNQIAEISAANEAKAYASNLCTLDGLDLKDITHVKLVFTGRKGGSFWISFYEAAFSEEGTAGLDTSWMMPSVSAHPTIASAALTGTWNNPQANSDWSVEKSADGNTSSFWNPEAKPNYTDDPGVLFTLKNPMDLKKLEFNFGTNVPYFNVFVSKNGADYTQIAQITAANEAKAYPSAGLCTLDGLSLEDITHVKLVFTGRKGGSFWISFYEATVSEEGTSGLDTSWMMPTEPEEKPDEGNVKVKSAALTGVWVVSQESSSGYGPGKTYDNDTATYWNPGANSGYTGTPGIVYTLDGSYDLTKLKMIFGNRYMYFDVLVSADGNEYASVATVTASNYATYYTDGYVCTIDGLTAKNVKYIKIVFTGDSQNMCWISFYELDIVGTAAEEPPVTEEKGIASAATTGTWNQDRAGSNWSVEKTADGNTSTFWNPEAKPNYTDNPGVIFTLKSAMDIRKLQFNFGTNVPYFNVFVSKNGTDYTQIAQITADNEAKAYASNLCTLDGLDLKDITHVKLVFTGRKGGSFWISFYEATVSEEGTSGLDTSWMMPTEPEEKPDEGNVKVKSAALTGTWAVSQESSSGYGPGKTYDNNTATYWNPGANSGYTGTPGIVYTLDGSYDLTKLEMIFGNRYMYFDVLVSEDGSTYTDLASVTASNYATYYKDGYVCALKDLTAKDVKYIKILFTGDSQNMCWISFYELDIVGSACESGSEEP